MVRHFSISAAQERPLARGKPLMNKIVDLVSLAASSQPPNHEVSGGFQRNGRRQAGPRARVLERTVSH